MKQTAVFSLVLCSLLFSCVSTPRPTAEEAVILERGSKDLARGGYEWVVYDMESYLQKHPDSPLSGEAHLLAGDAYKGQIDQLRAEGEITGIILNARIGPLMSKSLENYVMAAGKASTEDIESQALYKAAFMLDIEYMKNFARAVELYGQVISKFPGTTLAELAQERYDNLQYKFRNIRMGPHGNRIDQE